MHCGTGMLTHTLIHTDILTHKHSHIYTHIRTHKEKKKEEEEMKTRITCDLVTSFLEVFSKERISCSLIFYSR